MANAIYFQRSCPTCGRQLRIRVRHLGRNVVCEHCNAEFRAFETDGPVTSPSVDLLERADELLRQAQEAVSQTPGLLK